jgi:hypothetical protein
MIRASIVAVLVTLTPAALAQTELSPTQVAGLRAEQAAPRKPITMDSASIDRFVGAYQLFPSTIWWITRDGSHFLARFTGGTTVEYFPESATKFFSTEGPAQLSFESDTDGHVTAMIRHHLGIERRAPRISAAAAMAIEDALAVRIKDNKPAPGTEAALRHQIDAMENGAFDTSVMSPELRSLINSRTPMATTFFAQLGAFKSLTFKNVGPTGVDFYTAVFERGRIVWSILPLVDGKIVELYYQRAAD